MQAIACARHPGAESAVNNVRRFVRTGQSQAFAIRRGSSVRPAGVLLRQAANQCAKFLCDPRPAGARPRFPTPVQAETGPMPTHDSFGLDDDQRIAPARPGCSQDDPEQPIKRAQWRSGPFSLQDGHLLAKREDFDSDISTALEEDAGRGNQGQKKM